MIWNKRWQNGSHGIEIPMPCFSITILVESPVMLIGTHVFLMSQLLLIHLHDQYI